MASLAHAAVGVMAGRLYDGRNQPHRIAAMTGFVALSMLPDLDLLPVALGAADHGLWGHRGITHTFTFAAALSIAIGLAARRLKLNALAATTLSFLTLASHGILDTFTADTRGVPLLWPFWPENLIAAFRPIPEAPTGLGFFSLRGVQGALIETAFFLPLFVFGFWPRPTTRAFGYRGIAGSTILMVLAVASSLIIGEVLLDQVPVLTQLWLRAPRS